MSLPAGWTPERVLANADAWVWVPPEARELRTDDYHLVAPAESSPVPTTARAFGRRGDVAALVDEIAGRVAAWGLRDVSFWVTDDAALAGLTGLTGLADHLRARGAEHVESVDILAWDLTGSLPSTSSFAGQVRVVDDEESLRASYVVDAKAWGQPPPEPDQVAAVLEFLTRPDATEIRTVGYLDGQPVSVGGATFVEGGRVLRLWGAATRPAFRRRGAYQAVLAERLRIGRDRGAEIALVKAATTTSSPILRHLGFQPFGRQHRLRLSV